MNRPLKTKDGANIPRSQTLFGNAAFVKLRFTTLCEAELRTTTVPNGTLGTRF